MLWLPLVGLALARVGIGVVCRNHGNLERSRNDQALDYVARSFAAAFQNPIRIVSEYA
jgi:hypothetical protein